MSLKKVLLIVVFIMLVLLLVFFLTNNKMRKLTNKEFENIVKGMLDFAKDEERLANNNIIINFDENNNILIIDNNKIEYNLEELTFSVEMTFDKNVTKEEVIEELAKNTYMISFGFPSVAKYKGVDYLDSTAYISQETIDSAYYSGVIYKEINLQNIKNGIIETSEKMDLEYLKMESRIIEENEDKLVIKNIMSIKENADFSKLIGLDERHKEEIRQKLENM